MNKIKHILVKNGASSPNSIRINDEKTPEEVVENTKKELIKYGVDPTQKVTVTDPFTGVSREITLDRTGYGEAKLITTLADPKMSRDQRDFALSMYMFERGKDSASMMIDLIRYKGEHTKETRAFKSQMRFDFEIFVSQFSKFIREQSRLIGITLGKDIAKERTLYMDWLIDQKKRDEERKRHQDYTYIDYLQFKGDGDVAWKDKAHVALIELAIQSLDEGERIIQQTQNIIKAREREQGKGIYVDHNGKITTYDDPDLDEIIKADRERQAKLNKE